MFFRANFKHVSIYLSLQKFPSLDLPDLRRDIPAGLEEGYHKRNYFKFDDQVCKEN